MTTFLQKKRLEALVGAVLLLLAFLFFPMGYSELSELGAGVAETFNEMDRNGGVLPETEFVELYTGVGIDFVKRYHEWKALPNSLSFEEVVVEGITILGFYSIYPMLLMRFDEIPMDLFLGIFIFLMLVLMIWRWQLRAAYVFLFLSLFVNLAYLAMMFTTREGSGLALRYSMLNFYEIRPIWWAWLIVLLLYAFVIQALPWWRDFSKKD